MRKRKIWIAFIIIMVAGTSFFSFERDQKDFEILKNLDIYTTLFRELNMFYVDDINPTDLVKTSIDDMLSSLDPYTNYISEDRIEDYNLMTTGEYGGIGAIITKRDDKVLISEPYEGFPAQKSGLKAGDILLEVSDKSTENMTTEDVSNLLKGPANKPVKIKFQRPGEKKPVSIEVIREKISLPAVPYYGMLNSKTGYIRLTQFTQGSANEVKKAMIELEKNNPESLLLDLRGNPGGLLNEAVDMVNFFVPKGVEIVSTKGRITQNNRIYKATSNPIDTTIKIGVLVNRGSASASEIVAGAIQDLDRGLIIGGRTFGKGLVQTTRDLNYNTKLKVTIAKYYIPSGRCIQALDYSHRNEDGSVGTVPDSLISEFTTLKGRKVYDGGGVVPDIKITGDEISNLSIELVTRFLTFDFATEFANENQTIPEPEKFEITDDVYNQFVEFVKDNNFKYEAESKNELDELVKSAKKDKYYEQAKNEFNALQAKLAPDLDNDLELFREEISELLKDEIVSRYYYQKGAIRSAIHSDKGIQKAVDELNSSTAYRGYFETGRIIAMKTTNE